MADLMTAMAMRSTTTSSVDGKLTMTSRVESEFWFACVNATNLSYEFINCSVLFKANRYRWICLTKQHLPVLRCHLYALYLRENLSKLLWLEWPVTCYCLLKRPLCSSHKRSEAQSHIIIIPFLLLCVFSWPDTL